jgi:serine/threonine-protein kinase
MDWRSMGKKWQLRLVAIAIALGVIGSFRLWDSSSPISFTVPEPASKSLHKSKTPPLVASEQKFPLTPIVKLESFKHRTGAFTLLVPQGWIISDRLEGGKLTVSWIDPTKNSVISVEIFPTPAHATTQDLLKQDRDFIKLEFGDFPDFFLEEPILQKDGSLLTIWGYSYTKDKESTKAVINRYLQQQEQKTVIISVGFLEQHFDKVEAPLSQVINSLQINPEVEFPQKRDANS